MSAEEAASFEEHYFDCRECAEEVRLGAALVDGGRRVVRADRKAPVVSLAEHRSWRNWAPTLAAAALVIGLAVPQLVDRFRPAQPLVDITHEHMIHSEMRSEAAETMVVQNGDILNIDIIGEPSYTRYDLQFVDAHGKKILTRTVTPEQARESIPLVLRGWVAGTYELVIVGMAPAGQFAEVSRQRFTVKE